LAVLDRPQGMQDGVYERQQIFDLIGSGTDHNNRKLSDRNILLVGYALIHGQQDVVAGKLGNSQ
jgi:hypothetical protein